MVVQKEMPVVKEQPSSTGAATTEPQSDSTDEVKKPRIDWADPTIPVGNAPPLPRWPLGVAGLAWLGWVLFLLMMVLSRSPAGS